MSKWPRHTAIYGNSSFRNLAAWCSEQGEDCAIIAVDLSDVLAQAGACGLRTLEGHPFRCSREAAPEAAAGFASLVSG